jgi:membrane protease YdiL (CAAX protease family)
MPDAAPRPDNTPSTLGAEMAEAVPQKQAPAGRTDRELWQETTVVLVIGVFVPFLYSLVYLSWPGQWQYASFTQYAVLGIVPHVGIVFPVLYLISRSQEPLSVFGFTPMKWWQDSFAVVGLLVLDHVLYYLLCLMIDRLIDPSSYNSLKLSSSQLFPRPAGFAEYLLLVVFSAANGFSEELVMRGYLIPRFERLLDSTPKSIMLTSVLFAAYHVYQGLDGFMNCLIGGLLYGVFFCWLRRLWPLIVGHTVYDIIGFSGVLGS